MKIKEYLFGVGKRLWEIIAYIILIVLVLLELVFFPFYIVLYVISGRESILLISAWWNDKFNLMD